MLSRRRLLQTAAVVGGAAGIGTLAGPAPAAFGAPGLRQSRPEVRWGVQSGDVTGSSAVVWSKTDRPARMVVEIAATESFRGPRGRWAVDVGPDTDHAGKVLLSGLPAGTELFYRVHFAENGNSGHASKPVIGTFRTAPDDRRDVSFAWSGDVAGQGWGINPDTGGMTGFEAIRRSNPDFFLHSGDSVYADGPMQERVVLPDGTVWRNVVTPEKSKVAETLDEFRGQYRYNLLDDNVRRFAAQVPQLVQWDDHEMTNNWYPGEVLTDNRYTVKDVDTLAARGRQAFLEYMPIGGERIEPGAALRPAGRRLHPGPAHVPRPQLRQPGDQRAGDADPRRRPARPARPAAAVVPRGLEGDRLRHAGRPGGPDGPVNHEGIANRDPGLPLGRELELARLLSDLKRSGVRNVVWFTADVHYSPERAAFTDFDPFWEFVSGPLHAGTFGPNALDATFGPQVVYSRSADRPNQPPSDGLQFFGHVRVDGASGVMTVQLRDIGGRVLHQQELDPA